MGGEVDTVAEALRSWVQAEWLSSAGAMASLAALLISCVAWYRFRRITKAVQEDRETLLRFVGFYRTYDQLREVSASERDLGPSERNAHGSSVGVTVGGALKSLAQIEDQLQTLFRMCFGWSEAVGSVQHQLASELLQRGDVDGAQEMFGEALEHLGRRTVSSAADDHNTGRGQHILAHCLNGFVQCCIILGDQRAALRVLEDPRYSHLPCYRRRAHVANSLRFHLDAVAHWLALYLRLVVLALNPFRRKRSLYLLR